MSLLAEVEALGPRIRDAAVAMESAGRLDPALVAGLAAAGVFGMAVPADLGGGELPVAEQLAVLEALGRHDGATGWCAMIGATTAVLSAWMPRHAAAEIWSDPTVVTGGAYAPTGSAVDLGDAYRVTGRWEWGSGSAHCAWLLGGAVVRDGGGEAVLDERGRPLTRLCFAPADAVAVVPNWDVLGMRATGSDDLVMDGVEVPADRTVSLTADAPWAAGALYRFPPFGLLALGIAAVSLGVGRAAVEAVVELAAVKRPQGSGRALGDRSTVRDELARCDAAVRAARALLFTSVGEVWSAAVAGEDLGTGARADLRLAATHACVTVADAVARLHRLAGGTGVRHGQRIERCFRDAHVATAHVLVSPHLYTTVGGVLLGAEPGFAEL